LSGQTQANPDQDVQSAVFEPAGRWRVSVGDGAEVSLVVDLASDGTFAVTTEGVGFSFPASAGAWTYDPSLRTLALTGFNNTGNFFQALFQNLEGDGRRYRAFVPGEGNVVLSRD
jgi:hypothetical protein